MLRERDVPLRPSQWNSTATSKCNNATWLCKRTLSSGKKKKKYFRYLFFWIFDKLRKIL